MGNISVFTTICPKCGHKIENDAFTYEELAKDYYFTCDECDKQSRLSEYLMGGDE